MVDVQTEAGPTGEGRADGLLEGLRGAMLWEVEAGAVRLSFVTDSAAEMLGAPDGEWTADAGLLKKHVHPEDWGRFLEMLYQAAAEGGAPSREHRMLRLDGSTLWVLTTVQRSNRSNGALLLTGLTVDISHVKQKELSLRDAEIHFRLLVENIRDYGVFLLDLEGRVASWTPGAQRLKGYRPEEVIGTPLGAFFPTEEREKGTPQRLLARAELERQAEYEGWLLRKDGQAFWASLTLSAVTDEKGRLRGFSNVARDLSERRKAEQALRESEEHFRRLVESQDYGVFMASPTGVVQSWNRGAQRLSGYRSHEIVGTPVAALFPPEVGTQGLPERLLLEASRLGRADYEGWLVRKGGEAFWGLLTVGAVEDESGYLQGFSILTRDVTERRRTEQELRRSEGYFRLLVDSVQDYGVFMLSTEGAVESWNQGAQRLKGYRAQEAIGAPLSRFFPADENAKRTPERLLEQALLEGSATYEGWMVRKGGGRFWALVTLSAVEDEEGRLQGISNVARDLSERKKVEDAMRESEERVRLLIESVQDYGVFMLSTEGAIASWNPGAERMKGYRAEEIIGEPLSRFFPPEQVAQRIPEQLIARAAAEGRAEYEGWLLRKGGAPFWGSVVLSAVRDEEGRLRGLSNVARDLTERMRAEQAMSFLAEVGRVLAGSLDYHTTLDRVAELATRELAQVCILEMLVGSTLQRVAVANVDGAQAELVQQAVRRRPHPGQAPLSRGVARVVLSGQSELMPEVTDAGRMGEALELEDPDILRVLGMRSYMSVPLTARGSTFGALVFAAAPGRHYSTEELLLAEELARRAALAIDNARLYEEAQAAIHMREEVLEVVSHDLRNPLGAIRAGAAQLLAEVRGDEQRARTARIAERVGRASERMLHMIRDLLDFSSIEEGKLRIEAAEHEVAALVTDVVEMLHPIAAEKGLRLEGAGGPSGLRVRCDRERVMQVFSNLIGNAIKFTGEGGSVIIRIRQEPGRVVFSVSDTGPGISEEDRAHIFDRYWQSKKTNRGSMGLGLAISKAIIESHGGSIWVESTMGVGTAFFFTLPASA